MVSGSRHSGSMPESRSTVKRSPRLVNTASPKNAQGASNVCMAPALRESLRNLEASAVVMECDREWPAQSWVVLGLEPAGVKEQPQQDAILGPEPSQSGKAEECDQPHHDAAERQKQAESYKQPADEELAVTSA